MTEAPALDTIAHDAVRSGACARRVLGGKYVLGEVIGTGGMALVYSAAQPSLGRSVAVKLLRPEHETNPYMVCRFRNEAIASSRLSHPNIAGVIDFARTPDGVYYLVMEYVRGRRLAQLIEECGAPTLSRIAGLCGQLLAALAEVHAAGIVHADVKADNVLVDMLRDGHELAKLIDFGLARFDGEIETPNDQPMLAGTPEYLAPEVIRGERASIASDLYAVGVILYELITGATPFAGGTCAEILGRHLGQDVVPPSLRCVDREISPGLDRVVLRALAKLPADRFSSAVEFAAALAKATHGLDELELVARGSQRSPRVSTEAPTRDWAPELGDAAPPRLAAGTAPHAPIERVGELDRTLVEALLMADGVSLAPSRAAHVRERDEQTRLWSAAIELEGAVPVLSDADALWRVKLTLATLYLGLGERFRARRAALAGLDHATRSGCAIGRQRARSLIERLCPENAA